MFCGILNQTNVANSHSAFSQLCWFSGKCIFDPKVLKRPIQNTPQKGPLLGEMGGNLSGDVVCYTYTCIFTYM